MTLTWSVRCFMYCKTSSFHFANLLAILCIREKRHWLFCHTLNPLYSGSRLSIVLSIYQFWQFLATSYLGFLVVWFGRIAGTGLAANCALSEATFCGNGKRWPKKLRLQYTKPDRNLVVQQRFRSEQIRHGTFVSFGRSYSKIKCALYNILYEDALADDR